MKKPPIQLVIGLMGVKGSGKDTFAEILVREHGFVRTAFARRLYEEVAEAFNVTIDFLGDRRGKEVPLPHLATKWCSEIEFALLAYEQDLKDNHKNGATVPEIAKVLGCSRQSVYSLIRKGKLTPLIGPDVTPARFNILKVAQDFGLTYNGFCTAESFVASMNKFRSPRVIMQWWGTEYRRKDNDNYWLDIVAAEIAAEPDKHFVITDVRFPNEASFVEALPRSLLGRIRRRVLEEVEARNRAANGTAAHASETAVSAWPVQFEVENKEGDFASLRKGIDAVTALM